MFSLVGLAVLAAGPASADPPALQPPNRLPPTLYYQKDPNRGVKSAAYQAPTAMQPTPETRLPASATNTTPPEIGEIPVQNEESLRTQIVKEVVETKQSPIFRKFPGEDKKDPNDAYEPLSKTPYAARVFQPMVEQVEPMFVAYDRLYFEDKNTERYGWELGILQPMVSVGKFYADMLMFPYNFGTRPCQRYEADAGYCLPGDPVPYLIYPIELSVTGGLLEAGVAVGLPYIFQ
jgi:hypothetical protein